jgi:signal transduction histidine kinase
MPEGGSISISVMLDEVTGAQGEPTCLKPGRYARIAATDIGVGMDEATLRRATDAFFTTKPPGQGTGLGLASVRAFAEGSGGELRIESRGRNRGTTVTRLSTNLPDAGGGFRRVRRGQWAAGIDETHHAAANR